ncbi:MAG: peptidase T [Saprospiraceae bacterium]|nr:peptidase T [Saprospiraceae bacterium]MCB9323710.1 peptidase T [Lewinellaceae bacterium]
MSLNINYTVLERFLKYVQIDTQSDPESPTCPSTEKQKNLGKILVEELHAIGISDAEMDEHGYIYATIPSNTEKEVPVICFCSHMDTSPDSSGTNVKPLIHKNYDGSDIVLPDDPEQVILFKKNPALAKQIGNDIITASGLTLLGADDKAGLAEIMDAAHHLMSHPEIKHGKIRLLFTPDEEIGRGVDKADMERLGAEFGYTMDGEEAGSMENETFSADAVQILIHGVSAHPGFAKGNMESALKIAGEIIARLPKDRLCPEATEDKEGFIHPTGMSGSVEEAEIKFIIRDFVDQKLQDYEDYLRKITEEVISGYPNATFDFIVTEQYRNMKVMLDKYPHVSEYAIQAIRRTGLTPILSSIRGGTDGSRLSFMGLPCPNIFAGGHSFHSKHEWVAVQDMQKAVETIVHLAMIWEENGK